MGVPKLLPGANETLFLFLDEPSLDRHDFGVSGWLPFGAGELPPTDGLQLGGSATLRLLSCCTAGDCSWVSNRLGDGGT